MGKEDVIENNENPSRLIFNANENDWFMILSEEGIKFNHEKYPNVTVDGFAKAFIDLLEMKYKIKFIEKDD